MTILTSSRRVAMEYVARSLKAVSPSIQVEVYKFEKTFDLCIINWTEYSIEERRAIIDMAKAIHKFGECT